MNDGRQLIDALKVAGTGSMKLDVARKAVDANPAARGPELLRVLGDACREHGKGTPYGEGFGEGMLVKAEQLLNGTYQQPQAPATPAHKGMTHGDLEDALGDFHRSLRATVREALEEVAAAGVAGAEPIKADHFTAAIKETVQAAVEDALARVQQAGKAQKPNLAK